MSSVLEYLAGIEEQADGSEFEKFYLWPRTPMGHDHQDKIRERVGASDYEVGVPFSRPALIISALQDLAKTGQLPANLSVLDIACGDAIVLWQIKKSFPASSCFGMDCCRGQFGTHEMVEQDGVILKRGYIQQLFARRSPQPFDAVLMLNTYRGWESADLRPEERDLPRRADRWFKASARHIFLTATKKQILSFRLRGWRVRILGRGEDSSMLLHLRPPLWFRRL